MFVLLPFVVANGGKGGMKWAADNDFDVSAASSTLPIKAGTTPPASCVANTEMFIDTDATDKLLLCNGTGNGWTAIGGGSGGVPAGSILMVSSGACPTGYTEVNALNGKTLVGTLNANADVGTTGGADTITPAGTNAATATTGNCASTVKVGTSGSTGCAAASPNLTVPAETFTGTQFDNRSAFVKVIFCSKD